MPYKDPKVRAEYNRIHLRAYYQKNKAAHLRANRERRRWLQELSDQIKLSQPCADCQREYPPYVMDFHHRPGTKKDGCIPHLVHRGVADDVLLTEIAKCDLLCANCHRERTYG